MAFIDWTQGNWKIPFTNISLPDFGATELLGGNTSSLGSNTGTNFYDQVGSYLSNEGILTPSTDAYQNLPNVNTSAMQFLSQTQPSDFSNFKSPNDERITSQFDVDGNRLSVTDKGNILGLSDLKDSAGYQAYNEKYGGTGEDYLEYLQSGKAQEDAAIDQNYGAGMDFLSKLEQSLLGQKTDFLNTFTSPYDAQMPLINQAYQEGQGAIQSAQGNARQGEVSALDAARNLFSELNARNTQAFGGAQNSSVGQASGELLGRSMMQNFGDIRQNTTNTINNLVQKGIEAKNYYDAQIQNINMQKENALSQAKLAFQEKLDYINSKRFQLQQDKASAKLEALQNFNANVQAIRNQFMSFGQELDAMRTQADLNLRNALAAAGQYSGGLQNYGAESLMNQANNSSQAVSDLGGQNAINSTGGGGTDLLSQGNPMLTSSSRLFKRNEDENPLFA
jgi:hypothetical protein